MFSRFKPRQPGPATPTSGEIRLPSPQYDGKISVQQALLKRRSVREYRDQPLSLEEVSQLLWAAQGVTDAGGHRTAPSAGALYPLEVYLLVGDVQQLPAGVYRYLPHGHSLVLIADGDQRRNLAWAALGQESIQEAPAVILISAVVARTAAKYGDRAERYVYMEVGCAAQNVYLQAEALGLGTVMIGAFYDEEVKRLLAMPRQEQPMCIMPVGVK